jgi:hypothetical protein
MLKKELAVERKERLMSRLSNMYEEKYFIETLKIPSTHVNGFLYFAVENKNLADAVQRRNHTMTSFVLSEIATEYKRTLTAGK